MSCLTAGIAWVGLLSILAVALVAQAAETPREPSLGQNAAAAGDLRPPAVLPPTILDRFLHHADIIEITGRSYRLKDKARMEHDRALEWVITELIADHTELFKQFSDNPGFKKWLSDTIFGVTYEGGTISPSLQGMNPQMQS